MIGCLRTETNCDKEFACRLCALEELLQKELLWTICVLTLQKWKGEFVRNLEFMIIPGWPWELKVKRRGNGLDLNYCLRVSTKQITVNYACVRLCECTLLDDMSNDISIPVTHVWQQIILKRVSWKEAKKLTSPCNWTLCSQSTWRNPLHWVTTLNS